MQVDNRGVKNNFVGYGYIHDGLVLSVWEDSWKLNLAVNINSASVHPQTFFRSQDGKWLSVFSNGYLDPDESTVDKLDKAYREYVKTIVESDCHE